MYYLVWDRTGVTVIKYTKITPSNPNCNPKVNPMTNHVVAAIYFSLALARLVEIGGMASESRRPPVACSDAVAIAVAARTLFALPERHLNRSRRSSSMLI